MFRWLLTSILLITLSSSAAAQSIVVDRLTPPLPTTTERHIADIASWATVITAIGLDFKTSWDSPNRQRAFALQGVRLGAVYGSAYLVKTLVGRSRPCVELSEGCGIDGSNQSMFSAHTAAAFASVGPQLTISLPLSISTGGLRIMAGKHWLTDTLVGAGVGLLTSRIR